MVIFAQCYKQILYGFSFASVEFYGVEMRFANLEASLYEIDDLKWPKIEELELIVAFLYFTVASFGQFGSGTDTDLMLMLDIAFGQQ